MQPAHIVIPFGQGDAAFPTCLLEFLVDHSFRLSPGYISFRRRRTNRTISVTVTCNLDFRRRGNGLRARTLEASNK